jgi:methanogenic corrinoid protein MtbC1
MTGPINKKPIYNLNLVLQETGIKADTLRAWERRYQLPQPERTEGGHRLFSEYDIETIKWLIARQEEGMRISRAVDLWNNIIRNGEDPLYSLMADQTRKPPAPINEAERETLEYERNRWIQACLNFNESAAEQVLTQSFAQFSLETVCVEILQKGISEIGSLWYQGKASVQQEHFASELAVRRMHSLIAAAPQPVRDGTILVSCPEGEDHVFSPLMISLFLRYRSWNVIYLGANVPKQELKETIQKTQPDLVVVTAMRLATAAALRDMVLFVQKLNLPVAFGGRIFTLLPELNQKVPGYFLGDNLLESVSKIEEMMMNPLPPRESQTEQNQFDETIATFLDKKNLISYQTLHNLDEMFEGHIPARSIREANDFLAQDILAALSLGDIYLLGTNIDWVQSLLAHREFPQDLLVAYLESYYEAAKKHLDETGRPILEWLGSVLTNQP